MTELRQHRDVQQVNSAGREGRLWLFAWARFDENAFELRVDDEIVKLDRKALETLTLLLCRAGEVVTKDELAAEVWPGRVLSESVMAKAISRLRQALKDKDHTVIKTVHGFGYRLITPVKLETAGGSSTPRLKLKLGDHPPLRPHWELVQHLGAGGQGEVWLAQHKKTREKRTFKFARDASGLAAIKREITLYRYMHDVLGSRTDLIRMLDWNLAEAPYYLELPYFAGGNLEAWGKRHGGWADIALNIRLDIVAQVAEALAATHAVGALHKDLKPSNILLREDDPRAPKIILSDFGSGTMLDPSQLDALSITRIGFTQLADKGSEGVTPMYVAPEVMAGQQATMQADIYSLGVMLYQIILGDFKKPLAQGWEQHIDDPLLREDIAAAVRGDPSQRLADAAKLAERLRGLDVRHCRSVVEQTEQRRLQEEQEAVRGLARQAELIMARMQARRRWMAAALATLLIGLGVSIKLFVDARQARDRAARMAETHQAVADFLSKELFSAVDEQPLGDFTVHELLQSAADKLKKREDKMPKVAAHLHLALGRASIKLLDTAGAKRHFSAALLGHELHGALAIDEALEVASGLLASLHTEPQELKKVFPRLVAVLEESLKTLGSNHPQVLEFGQQMAFSRFVAGEWETAASELQRLIAQAEGTKAPPLGWLAPAQARQALYEYYLGEYSLVETRLRASLQRFKTLEEVHPRDISQLHFFLACALLEQENFSQAHQQQTLAETIAQRWLPKEPHPFFYQLSILKGQILLREKHTTEALAVLEPAIRAHTEWLVSKKVLIPGFQPLLAEAYAQDGQAAMAEQVWRDALERQGQILEMGGEDSLKMRENTHIDYAQFLLDWNRSNEAREQLSQIDPGKLDGIGRDNPLWAKLQRTTGLLALADGRPGEARAGLTEALRIYALKYGDQHTYSQRAREELLRLGL